MSYKQILLFGDFLLARLPGSLRQTGVFQCAVIVETWLLPRNTDDDTLENTGELLFVRGASPPKPPLKEN